MKIMSKIGISLLMALITVFMFTNCPPDGDSMDPTDASLKSVRISGFSAVMAGSGKTAGEAGAGSVTIRGSWTDSIARNVRIRLESVEGSVAEYAIGDSTPGNFSNIIPGLIPNGATLWIKNTSVDKKNTLYYKFNVTVQYEESVNVTGGRVPLTFNVDNPPAPSAWNAAGDIYEYPSFFIRANGNGISDPLEWEEYIDANGRLHKRPLNNVIPEGWTLREGGRRAEIKKILEYYHSGSMPPPPEVMTITSGMQLGSGNTVNLTVSFSHQGRTATQSWTITLPSVAPNGLPVSPDNKVPLYIGTPSQSGAADFRANGWATTNSGGATDALTGTVQDLFGFNNTDLDRPNSFVRIAWLVSRLMDALEMGAAGGVIDSTKIAVSGNSRNGKAALYAGAYAESKKGTRVAITIPTSSGCYGTNPERWTHQKQGLNRPARGYNRIGMRTINHYNPQLGAGAGGNVMVKLAPKDWPSAWTTTAWASPFQNGRRTQHERWQNLPDAWRSNRLHLFTEQNTNFNIGGGSGGIRSTAPFDQHFVASLIAPNVYMGVDGWDANGMALTSGDGGWVSQEPVYMTYLLTRELYDFLGVEKHCTIALHKTGHEYPAVQVYNTIDYAVWFFNTHHHPNAPEDRKYKRLSGTWPIATIEQLTDRLKDDSGKQILYANWYNPLAMEDYLRATWKNPNRITQFPGEYPPNTMGKSIADNIRAYFFEHKNEMIDGQGNPITLDYPGVPMP